MDYAVVVIVGMVLGVLMGKCHEKSAWKRKIEHDCQESLERLSRKP